MRTPSQWLHLRTAPIGAAYGRKEPTPSIAAACLALRSCASEKPRKKRYGRVAVQHEIGDVLSHDACPPEGPKRSVLIVSGSCPSSTRNLETSSTKVVDPQTKIFGFCPGRRQVSASSALSILPRRPIHPSGCLRLNVWTTRKSGSPRAIISSSSR